MNTNQEQPATLTSLYNLARTSTLTLASTLTLTPVAHPPRPNCQICARTGVPCPSPIKFQFSHCAHAACTSCLRPLCTSISHEFHHAVACPLCGVDSRELGKLRRNWALRTLKLGKEIWIEDVRFWVWKWYYVAYWVGKYGPREEEEEVVVVVESKDGIGESE